MSILSFGNRQPYTPRRAMSADTLPTREATNPIEPSTLQGLAKSALPRILPEGFNTDPQAQLFRADASKGEHDGDSNLTLEHYYSSINIPPSRSSTERPVASDEFLNSQIAELATSLRGLLQTIPANDRTETQSAALQAMDELATEVSGKLQKVA